MRVMLRQIGNSKGLLIPKAVLTQVGLEDQVEMTVEKDAIVLRKPVKDVRAGWAEASKDVARHGDDQLVLGDFDNEADAEWTW